MHDLFGTPYLDILTKDFDKMNQYDNVTDFFEALVRADRTGVPDFRLAPKMNDGGITEEEWGEVQDTALRVLERLDNHPLTT